MNDEKKITPQVADQLSDMTGLNMKPNASKPLQHMKLDDFNKKYGHLHLNDDIDPDIYRYVGFYKGYDIYKTPNGYLRRKTDRFGQTAEKRWNS